MWAYFITVREFAFYEF